MEAGEREVEESVGIDVTSTDSGASESSSEPAETESSESDDVPKNETARQTVERILRESNKEETPRSANAPTGGTAKKVKGPTSVKDTPAQQEVKPQGRLSAEEREIYNQLPVPLKISFNSMMKNHEQKFTEVTTKASQREKDAQHVVETVRPYLLSHPELQEAGFTEAKLVSALVASHQKLTNPATARAEYIKIGQGMGIPAEVLAQISQEGKNGTANGPDITNHPQFQAMQTELNRLKSESDGRKTQEVNSTVSRILSEMEAVREEKDANGKYLYPELFDSAFLDRVKPLVSALAGADPKLTYGEALKRARNTMLNVPGYSSQPSQTRLPAGNNNERAAAAAVSVRGRVSAPLVPGEVQELPPEALGSARETVAWALKQMRRGA